jgi:hypothetical protein
MMHEKKRGKEGIRIRMLDQALAAAVTSEVEEGFVVPVVVLRTHA